MKKKERSYGLDLVRVIAIILVVLVHSFGNTGFNGSPMNGMGMFLLLGVRCIGFCSVPLFILLTGYCKSEKTISKKHYIKIKNILIVYLVTTVVTLLFRIFYLHENISLYNYIIGIFNFSTLPYAWYIEMYIGLFLLIPFLNIMYKNIKGRKNKKLLIIILLFITSFPQTLQYLSVANHSLDVLPVWWNALYPILLYFIGSYIKEYKVEFNKYVSLFFIIVTLFIQTFMIYFYCQGKSVNEMFVVDYNFFPTILLSVLIFIHFYNKKCNIKSIKTIMCFISKLTLGIYFFSYIFDKLYYDIICFNYSQTIISLLGMILYTPLILISSLVCSFILNRIIYFYKKIYKYFSNRKNYDHS